MYKGFNLKIEYNDFHDYFNAGKKINDENIIKASTILSKFKNIDGDLVADSVIKEWFPNDDANIFLSHSHKDENLAIGLSGYIFEKFGLRSFIDSCIWGNSDELLRAIDDEYCLQKNGKYNYDKRNRSTSHVHIMLSSALLRMIDNTECIIFINTPNSISTEDHIENQSYSPWIYLEILTTTLVEKKPPKRVKSPAMDKSYRIDSATESLLVKYNLDLYDLIEISENDLYSWESKSKGKTGNESLDCLYEMVKLKK